MRRKNGIFLVVLVITISGVLGLSVIQVEALTIVPTNITSGSINVSFPNDFQTAKTSIELWQQSSYPYSNLQTTQYVLEGQAINITAHFEPYVETYNQTITEPVTLVASSDAFVSNASCTMTVNATMIQEYYYSTSLYDTFPMNVTIRSGEDGSYNVNFVAYNSLQQPITEYTTQITVWSTIHEEAADSLYTASSLLYPYTGTINLYPTSRYTSAQGESNETQATVEYTLATLAYYNNDWNGTQTHAQNTINLLKSADSADAAVDLQARETYLLQIATYPILFIAVLIMLYIIAATYRKIYPTPRAPKPTSF